MQNWRLFYWLVAGALTGFGVIGILSIGFPFLLAGLGMVIYGVIRFKARGFWAALIGFGTLPALILIWDIISAPPPCTGQVLTLPPDTSSVSCGYIPDSYYLMAVIFGVIALVGMVWPLLRRLRTPG
jgi:hypothetical protein